MKSGIVPGNEWMRSYDEVGPQENNIVKVGIKINKGHLEKLLRYDGSSYVNSYVV